MLFNSHPCADLIRKLHDRERDFYDYEEDNFVNSITCDTLNYCSNYPYHHWHLEHLLAEKEQELASEEYDSEMAQMSESGASLYPSDEVFARFYGPHAVHPRDASSFSDSSSSSDASSSSDEDTPIIARSVKDPSIEVVVHRIPK